MTARMPPTISSPDARRLFLHAQCLLDDPASRSATVASLGKLIDRLGFVQLDTINVVERAHHLILATRMDDYSHAMLDALHAKRRRVFEHWTHDASLIPVKWFAHWRPRFERYRASRWHARQMGDDGDAVVAAVLERVRRDGPLMSRDFEHSGNCHAGAWWGWKPHKVALDYLWRIGALSVAGRVNFQKVYDLTERVHPEHHAAPAPGADEHVDWACETALDRLGVATATEIGWFWHAVKGADVNRWISGALKDGRVVEVKVESADGSEPKRAYAPADLRRRLRTANEAAERDGAAKRMRILAPFDPVVRDRARAKRRFNFDYRFEAFVPAAQRKHGYYVMPVLEGERFVGRIDPKSDRETGELHVRWLQWEPGIKADRSRRARLDEALQRLAKLVGATRIRLPHQS
jgi:uncharacterized protein